MVKRLSSPHRISAGALSEEVGVPQSTLSKWLPEADRVPVMSGTQHEDGRAPRRPEDWSVVEKLRAPAERESTNDLERLHRRRGPA